MEQRRSTWKGRRLGCVLLGLLPLWLVVGCKVGPNYKTPVVPLEGQWREAQEGRVIVGKPEDPKDWWKAFNDPVLNNLIDEALKENLSLHAAGLRIIQARAVRNASAWSLAPLPFIHAGYTDATFGKNVKPDVTVEKRQRIFNGPVLPGLLAEKPQIALDRELELYEVGTGALWELDLWGGKRRLIEANTAELDATVASYDDVVVLVVSEVAASYVQIRVIDQRLRVLRENAALLQGSLDVADKRARDGKDADIDVHLARTILLDTKSRIPPLEAARDQTANALCVLLGKAPSDIHGKLGDGTDIPSAPRELVVDVPADLLRRRPDVRIAERQAAAQCARIGAIKAKLYPSLSIFGTIGLRASDSNKLFRSSSGVGSYGVSSDWNILLYPFINELVRLEDARFQEALTLYEEKVHDAAREVEDSIVAFLKYQDQGQLLGDSAKEARAAADLSTKKYADGAGQFSDIIDSLQYRVTLEDQAIATRGDVAFAMIKTYKALGGGWETAVGKPLIPEEMQNEMRERTEWKSFGGKRRLTSPR